MKETTVDVRLPIANASELAGLEAAIDAATCGFALETHDVTRFRHRGAHDPTPTHYFVLDELFGQLRFDEGSHLLDVGCGAGRVLAYFLHRGLAGRVTGVELDPRLAALARSWTANCDGVEVLQGSVLDLDLSQFTHFYLFNPFDSDVLQAFIARVEEQVERPCVVVHMSDNGETWWYLGRQGWSELASGEISGCRNDQGFAIDVYGHPQHYTIWRYDGIGGSDPMPFAFSFGQGGCA